MWGPGRALRLPAALMSWRQQLPPRHVPCLQSPRAEAHRVQSGWEAGIQSTPVRHVRAQFVDLILLSVAAAQPSWRVEACTVTITFALLPSVSRLYHHSKAAATRGVDETVNICAYIVAAQAYASAAAGWFTAHQQRKWAGAPAFRCHKREACWHSHIACTAPCHMVIVYCASPP